MPKSTDNWTLSLIVFDLRTLSIQRELRTELLTWTTVPSRRLKIVKRRESSWTTYDVPLISTRSPTSKGCCN